jgi:hypothetical protein
MTMILCQFCHFENADGTIFCEQCKSDLPQLSVQSETKAGLELPEPDQKMPGTPTDSQQPALMDWSLVTMRGLRIGINYPLYDGQNFIGRADERPVDIDLEDQEPAERVWSSRQHAVILKDGDTLTIEDLNSSNGTFLNRARVVPAKPERIKNGDIIQIGAVQLCVVGK